MPDYTHLVTAPLKRIDPDVFMMEKIIEHLTKVAKRQSNNIFSVPHSFNGLKGFEMFNSGTPYFLKLVDKRRFLNGRSRSPSKSPYKSRNVSPSKMRFTVQSFASSELANFSIEECKTFLDEEWEKVRIK